MGSVDRHRLGLDRTSGMNASPVALDARVLGSGRAGNAFALALREAGWRVDGPLGRDHDPATVTSGVDVVLLAVPDAAVAEVAASLTPGPAVVLHLSGALRVDVLGRHERIGSVHPLASLPDGPTGARRLRGAWFATAGDPMAEEVVAALGGRPVVVPDEVRVRYHAAAAIASNHLVALLGQVERIARTVGVPLEAYLDLARGSLDNVAASDPATALTGPVARGDWGTVAAHVDALPADERLTYTAMADAARRLVESGESVSREPVS